MRYTVSELDNGMFLVRDNYDGTMRIMSRGEVDYLFFGNVEFKRLGAEV